MNGIYGAGILLTLLIVQTVYGQPWTQNDAIFNPSGVPSLPFSQPRFADLDGDGDVDMILGSVGENLFYMENTGGPTSPAFIPGDDVFENVPQLDGEMGVCVDMDADGDPDLVCGGFTGLNLYMNTGNATNPVFEKVAGFFDGLEVGQNPIPDLADVDGDDDLDMVVGLSESGLVKLYTNFGSPAAAVYSEVSMVEIGDVGLYAYPNLKDLDGDLDQDLLVGRDSYGFVYYKNTGNPNVASWEEDPAVFEGL
ncbi:MAG: VCBS repeat-containing protein, partial [Bacteroidales bacterium]|nr:VCBS repeat-containing protein [Bacteroidales bacterium]